MGVIIPAILPTSYEDLKRKLAALEGIVDSVQIDIVDGRFVGPSSWPYTDPAAFAALSLEGAILPYLGEMHFEMDLMVSDPEQVTGIWIDAGADRITLHVESTNYLPRAITDLEVKYGHAKDFASNLLSLGLAINIQSDLALIEPYINSADYVQFMGIDTIGKQGEPFDARVLQKIRTFKEKYPKMPLQVDGGVSFETAPRLLAAGVQRLIVGSAFWESSNLAETFKKMSALAEEYGTYT